MKELSKLGKTIMVSSHILPELADICNKVGIIEKGVLLISADVGDVMRSVRQQPVLDIGVGGDPDAAAKLLEGHPLVDHIEIRDGRLFVTLVKGVEDYSDLAGILVQGGVKLLTFKLDEINLETAFMALTKGITA